MNRARTPNGDARAPRAWGLPGVRPGVRPGSPAARVTRQTLAIALSATLVAGLAGCASKPPPPPPPPPKPWEIPQNAPSLNQVVWTYLPKGLTIDLQAANDLNTFEDDSHTVLLCIYQLKAPAAFQELAATPGGLLRLLQCDRFDPTVADVQRRFVIPGEASTQTFDRAEGAAHVALVAGYYQLQPGVGTLLDSFPILKSFPHWYSLSPVYNPGPLTMNVLLAADSIQRIGLK